MVLIFLSTSVTASFQCQSGLSEAVLPLSGCDFLRETLCVARCQALAFVYAWPKPTRFHMRIWLFRGQCSWLFKPSESLLDSRKTEILRGFCWLLRRLTVYYTAAQGRPSRGHLWHENGSSCWRLVMVFSVLSVSVFWRLKLITIIPQSTWKPLTGPQQINA